jgi:hypothetical protein
MRLIPVFHSAIAADDVYSKKDFKAAVDEYKKELMLFQPADQTQSGTGLVDTLNLAEAYVKLTPPDAVNAVWFYARAWNFAPAGFKPQIEKKLDYWYNKYHGGLDGLDAIKTQAAATVFPPGTLVITPADTPQQKIHKILVNTPDLSTLALADKELVLAFGSKEDADKLWALMKDKETPVPGTVIEATASVIKVAVTDDAKQSKTADFIVNLKTPLADKDVPAVGSDLKLMSNGGPELDGTYDTYTQIPGTDTVAQSAQIVLRDGIEQVPSMLHLRSARMDRLRISNSWKRYIAQTRQPEMGCLACFGGSAGAIFFAGFEPHSPSISRWIAEARPVTGSQVTSAAHILGFPLAGSNLPDMPVKNRCSTRSFSTPITLSYGPLMPTSV